MKYSNVRDLNVVDKEFIIEINENIGANLIQIFLSKDLQQIYNHAKIHLENKQILSTLSLNDKEDNNYHRKKI